MSYKEQMAGCRFFDASYDFMTQEVNNPIMCDRSGDCRKCGWNPLVAYTRMRHFDIEKHRPPEELVASLINDDDEPVKGLFI